MNRKRMTHILNREFNKWVNSIEDKKVRELAGKYAYVTGGAIVSLLNNEKPNDLDIYFKNFETAIAVTNYYVNRWNSHDHGVTASVQVIEETGRIKIFIQSAGIAEEGEDNELLERLNAQRRALGLSLKEEKKPKDEEPYRPVFLSANAVTLSDGIQLITRFYGEPEEVHKNFDFIHCTNVFYPYKQELTLNPRALESFLFKELKYVGSKYPIASLIRTRKFIKRGYKVSAGEYLKMVFQVSDFDLTDPNVLEDQLNGVDLLYMYEIIETIKSDRDDNPELKIDSCYLVKVVEKIFDEAEFDTRLDELDEELDSHIEEGGQ